MYPFTLSGIKAGITRLREKGGASPDSLWDLVNAYINAARDIVPRPGNTLVHELPAGTIGLTIFDGKRHVYSHEYVEMTDPDYILHVLPNPNEDGTTIIEIHFAEPLMGYLFVVAEYNNGDVVSFYLSEGSEGGDPWEADTIYQLYKTVRPTTPNGFYYTANRLNPAYPAWEKDIERAIGDRVEPTVWNGYYFEVVDVIGSNPRSGETEPTWNAAEGALTTEDADNETTEDGSGGDGSPLPPDVPDRYPTGGGSNPGGNPPTHQL